MELANQYVNMFDIAAEKLLSDSNSQIYAEEGIKISKSVERLVTRLVEHVGHVDNRFKVSEILSVGGFYEGTKVGKADEFDYLVVIEELSEPGVLKAKTDGPTKASFAFKDTDLQSRWSEFVQDGRLQHFSCNYRKNHEGQTYGSIMVNIVKHLLKDDDIRLYDSTNLIIGDDDVEAVIEFVDDEDLSLVGFSASIPNIILNMEWKGMPISADISPAFRYYELEDLISRDQFVHTSLYDKIQKKGSLLLVTTLSDDKSHFKITFTEIEFATVKELSPKHINVYRFLKYVHYICKKKIPYIDYRSKLTSYIYKTACVNTHLLEAGEMSNEVEYMYKVLTHLYTCVDKRHIPSLFSKSQNLFRYEHFGNVDDLVLTTKQEIVLVAQVMQCLSTSENLSDLNEKKVYGIVANLWRGGGFKGYQNHIVCTHIKLEMSRRENAHYKITPRYRLKMVYRPNKKVFKIKRYKSVKRKKFRERQLPPHEIILEGKVFKTLGVKEVSKLLKIT